MRVKESFYVARPPSAVFDYVADPSNLRHWQTANRSVEKLTDGPIGPGSRFLERTKPPGGKEFEQITEFAVFDRPRQLCVHVVRGPQPIDGTWSFEAAGPGTMVSFVAAGELQGPIKLLEPVVRRVIARQFASYHRNLRRNLDAPAAGERTAS